VYTSWNDLDYRKAVSFDATGVFKGVRQPYTNFKTYYSAGDNRPHIAKYTRKAGTALEGNGRNTKSNYLMMRYAELLLIGAEAANEVGQTGDANTWINRVRARARSGGGLIPASAFPADVSGLTKDAFRTTVLDERKWELAFEFSRWYDIARRNLGPTVFAAGGFEGAKSGFNPTRNYLFPLPANELTRNPKLLPQNPGYN
jgi:hypothetical protein